MKSTSSLEVFRPVLYPVDSPFHEVVTSMARKIYDEDGCEFVAIRPSNETYRTTKSRISVLPEEQLQYVHYSVASYNASRFGKKIILLRDKLENDRSDQPELHDLEAEKRAGKEPVASTLDHVKASEFSIDLDDFIKPTIKGVDVVTYPMRYPGYNIFCYTLDTADHKVDTLSPENMLRRMSHIVRLAVNASTKNTIILESEAPEVVDRIPFALTRVDSDDLSKELVETVGELLPQKIDVGPIEFATTY